ncbi:LPXTG cell wall anchor domain-containing protein [Mesobacillus selenatarsenatis]|uniref:LPXTG cell wall anchor domain-containing protein n=1 Tax=Mesobacillus selenatarsenatis TaxID=388741 RepID=A0A846TEE6_9BACI|nr:LPXTG cell wall anchor domain-containing protein [Mesobacillus selenatarsenatis]NKE07458.1 LPXTG cell wall anchor domain-containing protein [Mesobacillus selenatarsenatis]
MSVKVGPSSKISILIVSLIFFFINYGTVNAAEIEIDINTNPHGVLFKATNIKPGDAMLRNLVIKNDSKQDFKYTAQVGETKSYKGLFEELLLLVKKDSVVLFDGKLKDFKGLNPRVLSKGSQETLFFQVTMPYELGNEFQGSAAEAEIIFYAEGITNTPPSCEEDPSQVGCEEPSGETPEDPKTPDVKDVVVIPKDVNRLPNTATNNYNLLLVGGVLLGGGSVLLLLNRRRNRRDN